MIKLVECPRDAIQGWPHPVPTGKKVEYLQALLKVGFDTIDFGSFVSPKAIPQMADTAEVFEQLDLSVSSSKLLAIVANRKGAEQACRYTQINYLGYPFSVSETFQERNTNSNIAESFNLVKEMLELASQHQKQLVVYISMGFGNPYGDPYSIDEVLLWIRKLVEAGVNIISLADTVGMATPLQVYELSSQVIDHFPSIETGLHLHASKNGWEEKVQAAMNAGCSRMDAAMKGIGGCPMAKDELVGNLDTEKLVEYLGAAGRCQPLNFEALKEASLLASSIFSGK